MARFHTYLLSLSQGAAGKIWNIKARPKYSWWGKKTRLDTAGKSSRGELSGASWEIEWTASRLDTIMASRLFGAPGKWLDAFAGRDSPVALSRTTWKWLWESEDNEYVGRWLEGDGVACALSRAARWLR